MYRVFIPGLYLKLLYQQAISSVVEIGFGGVVVSVTFGVVCEKINTVKL